MTKRPPNRYRGLCHCGEHAWAVLTRGFVTFVSPEDVHHLQQRKWYAQENGLLTHIYAAATGGKYPRVLLQFLPMTPFCATGS